MSNGRIVLNKLLQYGRPAVYFSISVITLPRYGERSIVMSVRARLRNYASNLYEIFSAVAWSSSGGFAICYVLPVLWVTSCLRVIA